MVTFALSYNVADPQGIETPWQFITNAYKLGLHLQTGSRINQQVSLRKSDIS